jgi:DNA-binding NarL/FixJ family response regulator
MESITIREQKAALRFVRDAYAISNFEQFVQFVLHALPTLIRAEISCYNEMDLSAQRSGNWVIPEQPRERDEGWQRVMDQEPVVAHHAQNPGSRLVRLSDFLGSRELRNGALFAEHYGPLGRIEDTLPIIWHAQAGTTNAFGLLRQKQFTDRELALLEFLRPHLIQAHANAVAFSNVTDKVAILQKALEASARAVVILGRNRAIKFAMQSARDWIREYFGPALSAEKLPESLDSWVRQHDSGLQQLLELPRPRDPLVINRENRRLIVRLLYSDSGLALLLEEQHTRIEPAALQSLGLSHRENQVLAGVANGRSKSEIASALAISRRTVDAHLQHIYDRLGVTTSNAAAAQAFQATRVRGDY